ALEQAVLAAFTTDNACRRKVNRPPGPAALAELARLSGHEQPPPGRVVSLADYQQLADATTTATAGARR
ncbi:MAG: IS21 family transposase, partial [Solirubrobacteraceae bacterium]